MPDLTHLPLFLLASAVLLLTPGPAVLYIIARSVDQGRRAGFVSESGAPALRLAPLAVCKSMIVPKRGGRFPGGSMLR